MTKSTAKKPALSNPTHEVRGPDGTVYFTVRQKGSTLRVRIEFDAPTYDPARPYKAGEVEQRTGLAGADDFMMGRWAGILAHMFGGYAIDALPVGTTAYELGEPQASLYDFQPYVVTGLRREVLQSAATALSRAGFGMGSLDSLPVTRPKLDDARAKIEAHKAALLDGSYRRSDGPMVKNTAPREPGVAYYPTYVQAEGSPVPADLLPAFLADADCALAYLDVLDSIPDLPLRPRKRPATRREIEAAEIALKYGHKSAPELAFAKRVIQTGEMDLILREDAERQRIRLANIETERRIAERKAETAPA
jgi:hypothetical protein